MKRLLPAGVVRLLLFEPTNVYFIMPLPYSQRARSIDLAYALHAWRRLVRGIAGAMMLAGCLPAWRAGGWRRVAMPLSPLLVAAATYMANVRMAADHMFLQPRTVRMLPVASNEGALDRLVVGITIDSASRA